MSEVRVTTLKDTSGSNSSTTAEIASGRAKAWVNFNGQGVVATRASFNVNSITDNGAGQYAVNFTTAMSDANYCASGLGSSDGSFGGVFNTTSFSSGSVGVWYIQNNSPALLDCGFACVSIFR